MIKRLFYIFMEINIKKGIEIQIIKKRFKVFKKDSSPDGAKYGIFPQGYITLSDTTDATRSTALVRFRYKDNKDRNTCAYTGDPGKAAPYDPNLV